jgi:hypothetical protein
VLPCNIFVSNKTRKQKTGRMHYSTANHTVVLTVV